VGFKTLNLFFLVLFLLNPSFAAQTEQSCNHTSSTFSCVNYIKNYDGDTITFNIKDVHPLLGEKINVRLFGVDTPEIRTNDKCEKEKGRTAKRLVANLLQNAKRIDLENIKRDKYFRILAEVKFDQKSLSEVLIKNGLAYEYFGKTKPKVNWCNLGREIAQDEKKKTQTKPKK
jgi:endonuclease YncB( thermonuclease family)